MCLTRADIKNLWTVLRWPLLFYKGDDFPIIYTEPFFPNTLVIGYTHQNAKIVLEGPSLNWLVLIGTLFIF